METRRFIRRKRAIGANVNPIGPRSATTKARCVPKRWFSTMSGSTRWRRSFVSSTRMAAR